MLLINQLSKQTQTPIPTIRYYEKFGLFKGKKNAGQASNNYRYYNEEVIEKLELIKEAKEIGFTLSEIKEIIDAWMGKRLSKEKKQELLQKKLLSVNDKIKQLQRVKKLINECLEDVKADKC